MLTKTYDVVWTILLLYNRHFRDSFRIFVGNWGIKNARVIQHEHKGREMDVKSEMLVNSGGDVVA